MSGVVNMNADRTPIYRICDEEGINIMRDVFDIMLDRGEVSVEEVLGYLNNDDRHVFSLYERYVAPGIDGLSDDIQSLYGRG
jgi:hypothetical protein